MFQHEVQTKASLLTANSESSIDPNQEDDKNKVQLRHLPSLQARHPLAPADCVCPSKLLIRHCVRKSKANGQSNQRWSFHYKELVFLQKDQCRDTEHLTLMRMIKTLSLLQPMIPFRSEQQQSSYLDSYE